MAAELVAHYVDTRSSKEVRIRGSLISNYHP